MREGIGVLAGVDGAVPVAGKRSDLRVRVVSAAVMVTIAGLALWLGGWVWTGFVVAIVLGILVEWTQLVCAFTKRAVVRALWFVAGLGYLGMAGYSMVVWLAPVGTFWPLPWVIASVIGVDVGAYFAGRTFGGPKIAPSISPSKTWSGLGGGVVGAWAIVLIACLYYHSFIEAMFHTVAWDHGSHAAWLFALRGVAVVAVYGMLTAIIAQSGDFFESWMKRRAGVKDSGTLIPGHGGLFDRADGLTAVLFVIGYASLITAMVHR